MNANRVKALGVPESWAYGDTNDTKSGVHRVLICYPVQKDGRDENYAYCVNLAVNGEWWLISNAQVGDAHYVEPVGPFPNFDSAHAAWLIVGHR